MYCCRGEGARAFLTTLTQRGLAPPLESPLHLNVGFLHTFGLLSQCGPIVCVAFCRYYNTQNINQYYDGAKKMYCDEWKIAVPGPSPKEEILFATDRHRFAIIV